MNWSVAGYIAVERLATGVHGEVWRGREDASGRDVALKRIPAGGGDADRETLRNEARALVSLRHPGLVDVIAVVAGAEHLVVVLELAAGGDLAHLMQSRGAIAVPEAVSILVPVALGLAAVHDADLVHGDVSAGNILLREDGSAALADLAGSPSFQLSGRHPSRRVVTPWYAEPLVASGRPADRASDVYALAAVLRHLVTGVPLWPGETSEEVVTAAKAGDVVPTSDLGTALPSALVDLIDDTIMSARRSRPTAAEFAERLAAVCEPVPLRDISKAPDAGVTVAPLLAPAMTMGEIGAGVFAPRARRGPETEPPRPTRRWRMPRAVRVTPARRAAAVAVVALAAAALAVGAWRAVPGSEPAASDPTEQSAGSSVSLVRDQTSRAAMTDADWMPVVRDLVGRRVLAFEAGDPSGLSRVYVAGSAALESDEAQVAEFARAGGGDLQHHVLSVAELSEDDEAAAVSVTETVPALVGLEPRQRTVVLNLRRVADGEWRIESVRGPSDSGVGP